MRVLAVGAHPDDVELGCGATLARHAREGDTVDVLVISPGVTSRGAIASSPQRSAAVNRNRSAALASAKVLGATSARVLDYEDQQLDRVALLYLAREVEATVLATRADVVYSHSLTCLNMDHRRVAEAVMVACRPQQSCSVNRVFSFEVPSSTEWSATAFWPTAFVKVSGDDVQLKLSALACYGDEMRQPPHPRSVEGVLSLARWRGATVGSDYAEAFVLVRDWR